MAEDKDENEFYQNTTLLLPPPPPPPPYTYALVIKLLSKRRTWVCLFIIVYAILLSSSWNLLKSILSWYTKSSSSSSGWPAIYASVLLGVVFGLLSMAAAFSVAIPAMLITWITILVLLAFCGKPRRVLVVEGRKITGEIVKFVGKTLLKEVNFVLQSGNVYRRNPLSGSAQNTTLSLVKKRTEEYISCGIMCK